MKEIDKIKNKWESIYKEMQKYYKNIDEEKFAILCETFRSTETGPPLCCEYTDLPVLIKMSCSLNNFDYDTIYNYYKEFAKTFPPQPHHLSHAEYHSRIDKFINTKRRKLKLTLINSYDYTN